MWDMIYAVWVVAINDAIVLNQIVLTRANKQSSQFKQMLLCNV